MIILSNDGSNIGKTGANCKGEMERPLLGCLPCCKLFRDEHRGNGFLKSFPSLLSHLECSECGKRHEHSLLQTVCRECGRSLLARYTLDRERGDDLRSRVAGRQANLWRYRELLPVAKDEHVVSLGEGFTPLVRLKKYGSAHGFSKLWLKEEGVNPTGSFKARGLCLAVSMALELGARDLCVPSAGNAGGALAAYAAAAGVPAHVYMPEDTPQINILECRAYGADVHLVRGLISDAAHQMNRDRKEGWFDISTLKEPYRVEGKKTLGFEIAEQLDWKLPEVIIYPTGGGTGLIGMWKAFNEMEELGWIGPERPMMVAVQSSGCAPIVKAYDSGAESSDFWEGASTLASGLRVPKAFADKLILRILRESGGCAIAVTDSEILTAIKEVAALEGILLCPEGALVELVRRGVIDGDTSLVVFNTGSGLKYPEVLAQIGL